MATVHVVLDHGDGSIWAQFPVVATSVLTASAAIFGGWIQGRRVAEEARRGRGAAAEEAEKQRAHSALLALESRTHDERRAVYRTVAAHSLDLWRWIRYRRDKLNGCETDRARRPEMERDAMADMVLVFSTTVRGRFTKLLDSSSEFDSAVVGYQRKLKEASEGEEAPSLAEVEAAMDRFNDNMLSLFNAMREELRSS